MRNDSFMLTDIAVDSMGNGATAGMSTFVDSSFMTYTNDATDWQESQDVQFGFGQDMNAMGNGQFGFVGETDAYNNSYGVLVSQDGGRDWIMHPWPDSLNNLTIARYGAFPSGKAWYVVGGQWPAPPPPCDDPPCGNQPQSRRSAHGPSCLTLSRQTCVELGAAATPAVTAHRARLYSPRRRATDNGYVVRRRRGKKERKNTIKQKQIKQTHIRTPRLLFF
jgi:hypothetical protein